MAACCPRSASRKVTASRPALSSPCWNPTARAAYDESGAKLAALQAALLRAQAEAAEVRPDFGPLAQRYPALVAAQRQLWDQRRRGLDESLAALQQNQLLAQEELAMNESLYASGDTSRVELLRARRQVAELQARMDSISAVNTTTAANANQQLIGKMQELLDAQIANQKKQDDAANKQVDAGDKQLDAANKPLTLNINITDRTVTAAVGDVGG